MEAEKALKQSQCEAGEMCAGGKGAGNLGVTRRGSAYTDNGLEVGQKESGDTSESGDEEKVVMSRSQ